MIGLPCRLLQLSQDRSSSSSLPGQSPFHLSINSDPLHWKLPYSNCRIVLLLWCRIPVQPLQPVRQRCIRDGIVKPHPLPKCGQLHLLRCLEERNTRRGMDIAETFLLHSNPVQHWTVFAMIPLCFSCSPASGLK